jgi:ATP adenylyltransferase
MRYVAAPWREPYVRKVHQTAGCALCRALKSGQDEDGHILHRGQRSFVILNKYPYLPGHLMVAPFKHLSAFDRSEKALSDEIADLLKLSLKVLKVGYRPQGFNVGMNLGRSAGAGVVDHYHLHVVPRWQGDSNFMPIIGRTKIVIEDLDATFARLAPLFRKEARRRST